MQSRQSTEEHEVEGLRLLMVCREGLEAVAGEVQERCASLGKIGQPTRSNKPFLARAIVPRHVLRLGSR